MKNIEALEATEKAMSEIRKQSREAALKAQIAVLEDDPHCSPAKLAKVYRAAYSRAYQKLKTQTFGTLAYTNYSTEPLKNPEAKLNQLKAKLNAA